MRRYRLSEAAVADVVDILAWSEAQFGEGARLRYERLVAAAIRDVAERPDRPGSLDRPELGTGVRSWHLRSSARGAAPRASGVRRPRHFLVFRVEGDVHVIGRILHDALELARHLDSENTWE